MVFGISCAPFRLRARERSSRLSHAKVESSLWLGCPSRRSPESPMADTAELLVKKLNQLPPQRLAEVEVFVDFLKARDDEARAAASQRLGEAMAKLDALEVQPLSPDEVQAEIEAARSARRAAPDADRR